MNKARLVVVLIVIALLLAGCASVLGGKEYLISGTVQDADGNFVEGITLHVSGTTPIVIDASYFDQDGNWSAKVKGKVTVTPVHDSNRHKFEPRSVVVSSDNAKVNFRSMPRHPDLPIEWKHLLLVYTEVDIKELPLEDGTTRHFKSSMPKKTRDVVVGAFKNLSNLILEASNGDVTANTEVIILDHPLTELSYRADHEGNFIYRADPDSETVKADLKEYAPAGKYDSVHVLWNNGEDQDYVDTDHVRAYWGLGGYLLYGGTATFDNLVCYTPYFWQEIGEGYGEPFLHEWLHGVDSFLWSQGFDHAPEDAIHAHENYGYRHSPPNGWMGWYSDYMQAKVWDATEQRFYGITEEMWVIGSPRSFTEF